MPLCIDYMTWDGGYGGCENYVKDATSMNYFNNCNVDFDSKLNLTAKDACPQCNECYAIMPTTAPTVPMPCGCPGSPESIQIFEAAYEARTKDYSRETMDQIAAILRDEL